MKKNPFTAALDIVSDILKWCCIVIMAFLIVAVAVQVIARRVLNNPTSWSEPLSQISFVGCNIKCERKRIPPNGNYEPSAFIFLYHKPR